MICLSFKSMRILLCFPGKAGNYSLFYCRRRGGAGGREMREKFESHVVWMNMRCGNQKEKGIELGPGGGGWVVSPSDLSARPVVKALWPERKTDPD